MEIRFYDNEETNWKNDMIYHKKNMEFIYVDEETPNKYIENSSAPELIHSPPEEKYKSIKERNRIFIQAYIDYFYKKENTYAKYLNSIIKNSAPEDGPNEILKQQAWEGVLRIGYPNNGLDIDDLLVWVLNKDNKKAVLSDWDRTITVCEGMFFGTQQNISLLYDNLKNGTVKMNDLLVYIYGGEERFEKVKNMFIKLKENNVPIYILTHNRNAGRYIEGTNTINSNREIYLEILANTVPAGIDLDSILFSSADYKMMKSIKPDDREGSYRKYKSACKTMIQNVLEECSKYITGGKKKYTRKQNRKQNLKRKTNKKRRQSYKIKFQKNYIYK
jgi:hypothetical protein